MIAVGVDFDPVADVCDWIIRKSSNLLQPTWVADESGLKPFWDETTQLLVCNRKLGAVAYIDDRAIRFELWPQALADLAKVVKP